MNSTEICNMALSYIGQGRINSIDDESEEARKCKIHYDHDRRRMLTAYPWGFAKCIAKLAAYTDSIPGWDAVYAYPAECLSVLYVYDNEHARKKETDRQDFEIVTLGGGRKAIATDVQEAWAEYTDDIKDPALFSEEFTEALTHLLASSIAMGITGNANIVVQHMQLAQQAVANARYYSVLEKERRTQYPNKYANERFS
ncbi:hypothetical protein [Selenomonas noxia]|jgi:hypothetical protein|nr:MAG TPA: tail tubular protein [Caudoviricetes sp.]